MDHNRPWYRDDLGLVFDNATRFFQEHCVPYEAAWRRAGYADRDIWRKAGQAGLLCASIPAEYGGAGGDFLHEVALCEAQASSGVGAFSNNVHSGIVAHYLLAYGSEAQKQRWLPAMATGELVGAIAMTEPHAGTDLQALKTTAIADGDEYIINGSKTFITNGYHANLILVAAKTAPDSRGRGLSLLCIDTRDLSGFSRGQPLEKLGQNSIDTVELFFNDVRVPRSSLLGTEEGRGFAQMMQQLPRERLLIAISAVASMFYALAETEAYVKERQVFDRPLIKMQNTRFTLAECRTKATVARSFVDANINKLLANQLDVPTAAMAKWWTSQTLCEIVDECLQLHGGYGFMMEYPIARLYADVRISKIYGGTNEIMKEIIARAIEA